MTDSSITVLCTATASSALATVAVVGDQVWMALIAAISAAVVAIPTIVIALKGTNKKIEDGAKKMDDLAVAVDGRLTKLLEESGKAKLAEGVLLGIAQATEAMKQKQVLDALIAAKSASPEPATSPAPIVTPVPEPSKSEVGI